MNSSRSPSKAHASLQTKRRDAAAEQAVLLHSTLAEADETIAMVERALVPLPNYGEFFRACESGDAEKLRTLLPNLDVNYLEPPGITGLHVAACNGHANVVTLLLDAGAAHNARLGVLDYAYGKAIAGATPLILAEANGRTAAMQVLLSRGAEPMATTDDGYTGKTLLPNLQRLVPGLQSIRFRVS